MHCSARALRHFFEIIVALAVLGCVLALPAAADTARDSEPLQKLPEHGKGHR
jgi:hypothetical protein